MRPDIADWLRGQLHAIRELTETVQKTVACHDRNAAVEMASIKYALNRADKWIIEATEARKT